MDGSIIHFGKFIVVDVIVVPRLLDPITRRRVALLLFRDTDGVVLLVVVVLLIVSPLVVVGTTDVETRCNMIYIILAHNTIYNNNNKTSILDSKRLSK